MAVERAVYGTGNFNDCYFGKNSAELDGGAIIGGPVTLTNCTFERNEAGDASRLPLPVAP